MCSLLTDPVPPIISLLNATSLSEAKDPHVTLLSWMSTPLADSYTVTITPPPPGYTGPLMSPDTNVTVSLFVNHPYRISVYGTNCGKSGGALSINYTFGECTRGVISSALCSVLFYSSV